MFPDRVDLSVNGAFVEAFQSAKAILRTQTNVNPAGGFTGGGTGNKAILGNLGFDNFPLSGLQTLRWRQKNLTPQQPYTTPLDGYMNLVVELDPSGSPGNYSLFSLCMDSGPVINIGVATTPAPNELQLDWDVAANYTQVVLDKGVAGVVAPVVGVPGPPNTWPSRSYRVQDILTAYPNARLRNANPADGGMPKNTIVAAVLRNMGDSGTVTIAQRLLMEWRFNGILI